MDNKPCRACRETGHDSTGNHLYMMRDGNRWTCRKTQYHKDNKVYYEDLDGNPIDDLFGVLEGPPRTPSTPVVYSWSPLLADYRGISTQVYYKYKTEGSYAYDGSLEALSHELYDTGGSPIARKVRKLPKDFFIEGTTKGQKIQLFGQSIFPRAKRVLITEGELDAMSAYQMLQVYKVACVSLPLGANVKALMDNLEYLKGFKEVYVCADQDDAGRSVSRDIANLVPHAKFMKISEKDANAMLQASKEQEFISAFWDAQVYKPPMVVRVDEIITDVLRRPVVGRDWPWPTLTKATYGRRPGEGMFIGAGVKCGKSEWLNEVIAFDCKNHWPIAVIKFEEPNAMTVKRVAGKIDGVPYHRPDVSYNDADLEKTVREIAPYLLLHQSFGTATWDTCKEFIRYAVASGSQTIIIDPLTKISNHLNSSDTETELRRFSDELACMAQDMGFFYIVSCHLKAPLTGPPHERGGKVHTAQFRGSRSMAENCYYLLGIERNKDPELSEIERNTSKFVLLEDRAYGNVCSFPVVYNPLDQSYREPIMVF